MRATASALTPFQVGCLEERFGRLKLADIGRRSHDGLVAEPTWLVVHVRNPFGGDKSAALVFATRSIDIRDSALRNVVRAKP
jgi:hypothetical protein